MKKEIEEILKHRGVKPTPNRLIVLSALLEADRPVSMVELDSYIETMDRSSIFRTLKLFLDHDIVHDIEDGGGALKYEVCHSTHHDHCSVSDHHVHFHCEICGDTLCLEDTFIPEVQVPEGFTTHTVNYMIKGICPKCNK